MLWQINQSNQNSYRGTDGFIFSPCRKSFYVAVLITLDNFNSRIDVIMITTCKKKITDLCNHKIFDFLVVLVVDGIAGPVVVSQPDPGAPQVALAPHQLHLLRCEG